METPNFNFESDAAHRFPILDECSNELHVAIDRITGVLRITLPDETSHEFPLTQNGDPLPQAVFITEHAELGSMIEVGMVDFLDQAEYLEDYPLNDPNIQDIWRLDLAEGGLAHIDLRNIGVRLSTVFSLAMVPVVLSISGIYLRVSTLKYIEAFHLEPWYYQVPVPQP